MTPLGRDYVAAIAAHLGAESEESLSRAYELGREALAQGVGILELLDFYETVLDELVLSAPPADQKRITTATNNFFREFLSPYEMSFRGYRDANAELKRLNRDLKAAYEALQQKQV